MNSDTYTRNVSLQCPTCGNTQFATSNDGPEVATCASCGRKLTREELLRENSENISTHVDEIKEQVVGDVRKELRSVLSKAFRGNENIRFK
jgi:predicted RNA-binding Zn-ribbon protein involved in translation (DUF1610 family)